MQVKLKYLSLLVGGCLLVGCSKSLTKDEAIKFVEENYGTVVKKATNVTTTVKCYGDGDDAGKDVVRSVVKSITGKEGLSGEIEEKDMTTYSITRNDFFTFTDEYKYSISGKNLTITHSNSFNIGGVSMKEEGTAKYNDKGFPTIDKEYLEQSSSEAKYHYTIEIKYTY